MLVLPSHSGRSGFSSGFPSGCPLRKFLGKPRPSLLWGEDKYIHCIYGFIVGVHLCNYQMLLYKIQYTTVQYRTERYIMIRYSKYSSSARLRNSAPRTAVLAVMYSTVLYCTALYCTVLHCSLLYCSIRLPTCSSWGGLGGWLLNFQILKNWFVLIFCFKYLLKNS